MTKDLASRDKLRVSGLDKVCFAETKLSHVDGEEGILMIAGYSIENLAHSTAFEGVSFLLIEGSLPTDPQLKSLETKLGDKRAKAFPLLERIKFVPENGMDYLRSAVSTLGSDQDEDHEWVIAILAVAAAKWNRLRLGLPPIAPDPTLPHGHDYLRMALGIEPDAKTCKALNSYLVTVSDHGMNASTFAARVVASTGSDLTSSVVAAIGALKGPLHGGAPGPVLKVLEAIHSPENAESWIASELRQGRKIMGMGHRIYRVRDPRAQVLEQSIASFEDSGRTPPKLMLAKATEKAATRLLAEAYPERALKANVEFYTAVLLDSIGLPPELFSPTFAVGRAAGWCAHVKEQKNFGRLVRPNSEYVGPVGLTV